METKIFTLLGLIFIMFFALLTVPIAHSVAVNVTVTANSNPSGVAYDPYKGTVFVTNYGNNSVSVISDSINAVIANISVGPNPEGVACDPDSSNGQIFVADSGNGTVSIISDYFNTVIGD